MKKLLLLSIFIAGIESGDSQVFSRESLRGAAFGGLLGGIVGHNSNRRTAEGIGIGAGAGWLLGSLSRSHRERGSYDTYIPSRHQSVYADTAPRFRTTRRPNYAIIGAATGALAGSVIGHNQNRRTMEGLGIGAATGLVLGGVAEHATRLRERRHYFAEEAHPQQKVIYHQPIMTTTQPVVVYVPSSETETLRKRPTRQSVFKRVQSSSTSRRPKSAQADVVINNYYITNNHLPATNSVTAKK